MAAFAIGGGIILIEIAHQEGYINVDWSKITKKLDKVSDKVETAVTGKEKTWVDKVSYFLFYDFWLYILSITFRCENQSLVTHYLWFLLLGERFWESHLPNFLL